MEAKTETGTEKYLKLNLEARMNAKVFTFKKQSSLFTFAPPVLCFTNSLALKVNDEQNFSCQFDLLASSFEEKNIRPYFWSHQATLRVSLLNELILSLSLFLGPLCFSATPSMYT